MQRSPISRDPAWSYDWRLPGFSGEKISTFVRFGPSSMYWMHSGWNLAENVSLQNQSDIQIPVAILYATTIEPFLQKNYSKLGCWENVSNIVEMCNDMQMLKNSPNVISAVLYTWGA